MRLCIASGKGGTGKTTVATNLARVAAELGRNVAYVDCDVDDPNGHLFLRPALATSKPVATTVPAVDLDLCTHCGLCADICQFNAILCLPGQVLLFPEMCHSCGGCVRVCPVDAIEEVGRDIGKIERGTAQDAGFLHGVLNVGEAKSPPLIRAIRSAIPSADLEIVDGPPGTSCPVVESLRGADLVVLVTEPTPFGLNDLQLAVEMLRELQLEFGVVLNRSGSEDSLIVEFCAAEKIPIFARIPDDRAVAEAYSRGELACAISPQHRGLFVDLLTEIEMVEVQS